MQNPQSQTVPEPKRLDWTTMVVPFLLIIILCLCFLAAPDASKAVLENLRGFLGENFRCRLSCHRTRHLSSVNLHRLFPLRNHPARKTG